MSTYVNRAQALAERLVKLRDYLCINATPAHAVKAVDILEYLKSVGHEVKIKTVYRDIETLRNFFRLEIDYDGRQRGYFLRNPPFEPHELRSIVNSIQAAQFITQQEADSLTQKIMKLADEYTRPSLNRQTYIPNRVRAVNEEAMKGLDTIYEAIAQDKKISFMYIPSETTKLRVDKDYISDIISKFGNEVFVSPDGNTSFIATIHEEATPELYMWTQKFCPPIEIIYPENAEAEMKEYFLSLAKGEAPDSYFYGLMKGSFPYDNIR